MGKLREDVKTLKKYINLQPPLASRVISLLSSLGWRLYLKGEVFKLRKQDAPPETDKTLATP